MMRKVTLVTAAATAELGNPGLEGGGSGMQGTAAGGLLAQGTAAGGLLAQVTAAGGLLAQVTAALGCRARKGGGRMWSGLLANPSLV